MKEKIKFNKKLINKTATVKEPPKHRGQVNFTWKGKIIKVINEDTFLIQRYSLISGKRKDSFYEREFGPKEVNIFDIVSVE